MRPWLGGRKPVMIENNVVLPAPFGPISAVIWPASAVSDAWSTASRPPKRLETFSTRSRGSVTATPRCSGQSAAQVGEDSGDAARREGNDNNQHATVDDEIEARRAAGHELGQLAQRLDYQRTEQWTEHGADAADDRSEQALDRDPRAVGDARIDEQVILRIKA